MLKLTLIVSLTFVISFPASANIWEEKIRNLPNAQQALALERNIQSKGFDCVSKSARYLFTDEDGSAYFLLKCASGRSFAIKIIDDAQGSTKVLDCESVAQILGTNICTL